MRYILLSIFFLLSFNLDDKLQLLGIPIPAGSETCINLFYGFGYFSL